MAHDALDRDLHYFIVQTGLAGRKLLEQSC